MEDNAVTALRLAGDQAVGFGLWSLVTQADPVVKVVLAILLLASIWSWTVIFDKTFRIGRLRRKARAFERAFWSGAPLDELYRRLGREADHPMAMLFAAAMEEWRDSPRPPASSGARALLERIGKVMMLTLERELEVLERYLSSLATIGSTAPFVGLFGTVWGIMNSFQSIALTKNTTLAVVAPGIAEALLATALGLIAAIPAVVAYNKLSGDLDRYANRVTSFADEFTVVLSRELETGRAPGMDSSRAA
ncbi:MAG TPA: protein TolQ [Geminicoccaceae bacterium]|jgi:biopolymer transport protein TolQ|nr:protein TolQ [Geminicoccaceae bacterium]